MMGMKKTKTKKPSNKPPAPSDSDFKPGKDSSDGNGDKKKAENKSDGRLIDILEVVIREIMITRKNIDSIFD